MLSYKEDEATREIVASVKTFMDEEVLPLERTLNEGQPVTREQIDGLRESARERGIYCPQLPKNCGGQGLSVRQALPVFEEAGRSLLGPPALRISAPNEGNMALLEEVGTPEQLDRWLQPLADGTLDSAIAMTEPMQGAGSDPKMIRSEAYKDGDEWILTAHKWWTTNGQEADLFFVMARTDPDAHPYQGCSVFVVPADRDGVEIVRSIPHLGSGKLWGSHTETVFDEVRVPEEFILGEPHEGFSVMQRRLGPARLTHCMRFIGLARRSLDIARAYMMERSAFGSTLAEKQSTRFRFSELLTELHAGRLMVRDAARKLDAGEQARLEVAMCKSKLAPLVQTIVDTAIQACGGAGLARDLPLADFYEDVRAFRIIDGADEVHRRSIAKAYFDHDFTDEDARELDNLPRYRFD